MTSDAKPALHPQEEETLGWRLRTCSFRWRRGPTRPSVSAGPAGRVWAPGAARANRRLSPQSCARLRHVARGLADAQAVLTSLQRLDRFPGVGPTLELLVAARRDVETCVSDTCTQSPWLLGARKGPRVRLPVGFCGRQCRAERARSLRKAGRASLPSRAPPGRAGATTLLQEVLPSDPEASGDAQGGECGSACGARSAPGSRAWPSRVRGGDVDWDHAPEPTKPDCACVPCAGPSSLPRGRRRLQPAAAAHLGPQAGGTGRAVCVSGARATARMTWCLDALS